jgi:hypothetical protein
MRAKEQAMTELTNEQVRALEAQKQGPLQLVHPGTREVFVLIPERVYQLTSRIVVAPNRRGWEGPADDDLIRKQV